MIIDKEGKLFGKVSIIDILFILVIIIGILGVFFVKEKLSDDKVLTDGTNMLIQSAQQHDKLEVRLKVKEVRSVTRDAVVVGDDVYIVSNDEKLGTVLRVESTPAKREVLADDGTAYVASVPERYDVTIVVEVNGKQKSEGFYTDFNMHLLYGKEMEIKTSTIQTTMKVDGISVMPSEN